MSINPNPENKSLFRLENALILIVYVIAAVLLITAAETILGQSIMPTKVLPF